MQVLAWVRLSVCLYVLHALVCQVSSRYLDTMKENDASIISPRDMEIPEERPPQFSSRRAKERTLYQLLISALGDSDLNSYHGIPIEAAEGEKRDTYKQAKPCYWSLVSCYRKRGYVYVGRRRK